MPDLVAATGRERYPPRDAPPSAATWEILTVLEANQRYLNLNPKCEPQLGKSGLYGSIGGRGDTQGRQMAMLWVLNLSDGDHTLLDVADRSGLSFTLVTEVARTLQDAGLLAPAA